MGLLKYLRSSLTYPIAATLVLVTVVPVALVGLLLASYNRDHLTTVEKRFLSTEARSLAGEISEFFSGHRTQLKSTIRGLEAGGEIDVKAFEVLLQDIATEPGRAFIYLQILDSRGEGTYVMSPALSGATVQILNEAVEKAHTQALAGREVQDLLIELPPGETVKAIHAIPLRSPDGSSWGSLIGVFVGGLSGGLMSGILTGIPGTPSSVATTFDGFPMARNGRPSVAAIWSIESMLSVCVLRGW